MAEKIDLILVPTDFSPNSCEAFSWASLIAKQFHAKIIILHVLSEATALEMTSEPGWPWEKILQQEDEKMIENFNACFLADFSQDLEKESVVGVGKAHEQIIDIASREKASLIVMATHGRTGLAHTIMGSVAEKVIRHSPCPVLTIRPRGSRDK